jgi:hypothetical protein
MRPACRGLLRVQDQWAPCRAKPKRGRPLSAGGRWPDIRGHLPNRRVPNACRFCGVTDRRITREHIWPEWLKDFVPSSAGLGYAERWSSADGRQRWRQGLLAATVRRFCEPCNTGWMSAIEGAAKPVVGPMVQGIHTTLDAAAQRTVANWVTLKGISETRSGPVGCANTRRGCHHPITAQHRDGRARPACRFTRLRPNHLAGSTDRVRSSRFTEVAAATMTVWATAVTRHSQIRAQR